MKEIKKQVESILLGYPAMRRELKALEFELQRFTFSIHPERIKDLTFSRSGGERVSGSRHSDKTADIAIEHYDSQINGEYHALRTLIGNMRFELDRVDHYLSLIPEKEAEIIQAFYFEGLTLDMIAEKTSCAKRTLQRHKANGLAQIVHFYAMLDKLHTGDLDILAKAQFIGHIHEERFASCLKLIQKKSGPGTTAMLYIISGCNELWNLGAETFYNFKTGVTVSYDGGDSITEQGRTLLDLAYHLAGGFEWDEALHILRRYFPSLKYVHLELAVEAIKLALLSRNSRKK